MRTPSAADLFMAMWHTATQSEEIPLPGSAEWGSSRAKIASYWASVWIDCATLAAQLEGAAKLAEQTKEDPDEN